MNRLFVSEPQLDGNEQRYLLDVLASTQLTMGKYVAAFEEAFAAVCQVKHAVSCMNGTVALHLALVSLGLKPGDEVLVPALTYVATANAVRYCGATPVFVDVDPSTWCMNPLDLRRHVTRRTVGMIPVHLYGHPADMDLLLDFCSAHGIWCLEDAAEAHGAHYKQRVVGSLGFAAAFSFYGNKIITCGEGGMVTTDDDILAKRCRLYRGQGVDTSIHRYHHAVVGYNYRMTNMQAALGLAQLERMPIKLMHRQHVAALYRVLISQLLPRVELQAYGQHVVHANWMVTVLVPSHKRDQVIADLEQKGIETRPTFKCMHHLPMYASVNRYPIAEDIAARGINLPTHAGLTHGNVHRVVEGLVSALR